MSQATLPGLSHSEAQPQGKVDTVSKDQPRLKEGEFKYATPLEVIAPISDILGGFDLDPCASEKSVLAKTNIRGSGGLSHDWNQYKKIWLNHPFGRNQAKQWLSKAVECDAEIVVALSIADPSTNWFHEYVLQADLICFPDDRVPFVGYEKGLDRPVMFSVYGTYPGELRKHFEDLGWVATAEDGYNEIRVQHPDKTHHGLLPALGLEDECLIEFETARPINGIPRDLLACQPLTRRVVGSPEPWNRKPTQPGVVKTEADFPNPYFELTCTHTHRDGTESWVVLTQNISNPREVHCFVSTGREGFREYEIARVQATTAYQDTPSPSIEMVVC